MKAYVVYFTTDAVRDLRFDLKTSNRKINAFQRAEEVCKNSNNETEMQVRISGGWNSDWKRVHSLERGGGRFYRYLVMIGALIQKLCVFVKMIYG
jgi:hypothetical protein